jgi:uncharacterized protein
LRGRALITGASAGIGTALALEFARHGHDLILTGRNLERLRKIAEEAKARHGVDARALSLDLAEPGAPARLAAEVEALGLGVDILVNNAGLGVYGLFWEYDAEREREMRRVNQDVPVELCRAFLPKMLARKSGGILNVASTASYQPGPRMALYHAGKAFLLFFSDALREELRGTGVTVTALCPGPTVSEFQGRMGVRDSDFVNNVLRQKGSTVARAGYAALAAGRGRAIPGLHNKVGTFLGKVLPWSWGAYVVGRIQASRKR